jgi:hypothetical protein
MKQFHHFKQQQLNPPIKPCVRLHWLNGNEWRGILLVVGLHEFGFRFGKD